MFCNISGFYILDERFIVLFIHTLAFTWVTAYTMSLIYICCFLAEIFRFVIFNKALLLTSPM